MIDKNLEKELLETADAVFGVTGVSVSKTDKGYSFTDNTGTEQLFISFEDFK